MTATVAILQYRSYSNSRFSATVSVDVLAVVSLDFLATVSLGAATVLSLLFTVIFFFNLKSLENKESIINENKTKFKTNLIVVYLLLSALL